MTVKQFARDFSAFIFGLVGASFTLGLALSGAFDWAVECLVLSVCCCFAAIASIAWLAIAQGGYDKHDRPEQCKKRRMMQSQPTGEKTQ